jgi:hypothetical protein
MTSVGEKHGTDAAFPFELGLLKSSHRLSILLDRILPGISVLERHLSDMFLCQKKALPPTVQPRLE